MARKARMSVKVVDASLVEVLRKVNKAILATPLEHFYGKATNTIEEQSVSAAPNKTGTLRSSHTREVDRMGIPRFGFVVNTVDYAKYVHAGRPPGPRGRSKPIRWMRKAINRSKGNIRAYMTAMAREIEKEFRKR